MEPNDPFDQHRHGTLILGCIGAYMPGSLVGGAYDASFVLCKTEDTTGEYPAEEDNYVAGLQFIEANGADMSTASLGYIDWYTQAQLDGQTAVTTIAVNLLTANGVHHCNAAGNEYHDSNPNTSSLIAPADGFDVLTCGAVTSTGSIASFSSDGPTADGRVKPELLARGVSTHTVSPSSDSSYTTADGTSLSTPLLACTVACLVQARPHWTVDAHAERLFETADYYVANGTYDPTYVRGYGIVDAYAAYDTCDDAGVVTLDSPSYACDGMVTVLLNDCGLNTSDTVIDSATVTIASDSESAGETVVLTELAPDAAEFSGSIALGTADAAGTLLVADGDTITVTYIDADDGQGGVDVVVTALAGVDCTPPNVSGVYAANIEPRSATIAFTADEVVRGTVHYGLSCGALYNTAGGGFSASPTVALSGLQDNTTYYYIVVAADEAGNETTADNNGNCYSFTTPEVPDFYTEVFESGFDLANHKLTFTPNGSVDFYAGCVEAITALPTDPAGGTSLSLGDDDSESVALTGGATVGLYGSSYGSFYVSSNGYVTFGSSDTDYSETLEEHFELPRVAALYDDLNPSSGGTISYRQLADRIAVTWDDVPEYSSSNSNTFQIELHFDGTITISYLAVAVSDAIVGLSEGVGVDPDFLENDLSNLGPCGEFPPQAQDLTLACGAGQDLLLSLPATDDGLPNPPGALTYTVTGLPLQGTLTTEGGTPIDAVPFTLTGRRVVYCANLYYTGTDTFTFLANDGGIAPDGGDSNEATVTMNVTTAPWAVHREPLDSNPGWSADGLWAFGVPTGAGSHDSDPAAAHTGDYVYGFNLAGDYPNNLPGPVYLTSPAYDCSGMSAVELRFARWLGVEEFDTVTIEVSTDGQTWDEVWSNAGTEISDASWHMMSHDLSAWADGAASVQVRWGLGPTDHSVTYPGWNLDDVALWGMAPVTCRGDANCDGLINFQDIPLFKAALGDNQADWAAAYAAAHGGAAPPCEFANCDATADGLVNFQDIPALIDLLGTACQ
jgi:hypothetical protein